MFQQAFLKTIFKKEIKILITRYLNTNKTWNLYTWIEIACYFFMQKDHCHRYSYIIHCKSLKLHLNMLIYDHNIIHEIFLGNLWQYILSHMYLWKSLVIIGNFTKMSRSVHLACGNFLENLQKFSENVWKCLKTC